MRRLVLVGLSACLFACGPADDPSIPKGSDFILATADAPFDSTAQRGKLLLIYFGYTHCPDVCPAALGTLSQVVNTLSEAERAKLRMLMISLDPARDTVQRLKEYTAFFHPQMQGGVTSQAEVDRLVKAFGAGYVRQPAAADGSYAIDHSSGIYLVGVDGKLKEVIQPGLGNDAFLSTLRKYL